MKARVEVRGKILKKKCPSQLPTSERVSKYGDAGYETIVAVGSEMTESVLTQGDGYVVKLVRAKQWNKIMLNDTYRVYFDSSWTGLKLTDIVDRLFQPFDNRLDSIRLLDEAKFRLIITSSQLDIPITYEIRQWKLVSAESILDAI